MVPQQETIQYGIKEPFIKLKRINAFLSAKALHVSQLKQFIKGEGFLFKIQVKPNYPTWNLKLFVWDQNWIWGKQLPQYHVLERQCMDFVDKEATGKRERFWCLTLSQHCLQLFGPGQLKYNKGPCPTEPVMISIFTTKDVNSPFQKSFTSCLSLGFLEQ